ncbi:MAG: TetR/AcrR family transcriptional regulator [Rhizobiaceae bacterium]|nr:TetR/AcrR family transcriptional regulator [Rhizobiaceae bacterium]
MNTQTQGRMGKAEPAIIEQAERPTKSEATRQRILDAAALVFGRKGFAQTRLSDIAKVADMKAGSLYYHFSSREKLVAEVMSLGVNSTFETVSARLNDLPDSANSIERIQIAIETHLLCLIERSDYARAVSKLSGQVPRNIQAQHEANEAEYGKVWRKLLRDAAADGSVRNDLNLSAVRMFILGAMSWSIEWYKPENGSAASVARDFSEMVINGLRSQA